MFRNSFKNKIIIILLFSVLLSVAQEKKDRIVDAIYLNIGLTGFKDPFYNNLLNNDFPIISKAGLLGVEFYNKANNLSLEFRKTYWVSLSPSNSQSPISATANYDYVSLIKYLKLNTKKTLSFNLGYAFIRENGYRYVPYQNIVNPRPTIQPAYIPIKARYNSYTSEAVTVNLGLNMSKKFCVELRANYYTKIMNPFFHKGVSINTLQLSFFYKLSPDKNRLND